MSNQTSTLASCATPIFCNVATYWTAIFGHVAQDIHLSKSQDYLFGIIKHLIGFICARYGKYFIIRLGNNEFPT